MEKPFKFKCETCGLCQDDGKGDDYICKKDDETELDLWWDDAPEMIKKNGQWVRRFTTFCNADVGMTELYVDQTEFYSVDSIYSALDDYLRQIEMDATYFHLGSRLQNGKYRDVFVLNNRMLGYWLDECIAEIDKAKAGLPYGKGLFHD